MVEQRLVWYISEIFKRVEEIYIQMRLKSLLVVYVEHISDMFSLQFLKRGLFVFKTHFFSF